MLRGGVLKWATRALPLALVVGLVGVGTATNATALGPAILVGITVTPAVTSIEAGTTQQFHATGIYSDSTTQNLTNAVTWSSSSSSTATISNAPGSEGLATAVAQGAATITATDPSAPISGTAALAVTPVSSPLPAVLVAVTVAPAVGSIAPGATQQFTATGTYSDSSTQDLTHVVTWSSSVSGTATISNASGSQGLATAVADGATTITATDPSSPISGTAALTVTPALPVPSELVAITVAPAVGALAPGATQQFTATGIYSDSSSQDLTDDVAWSSSVPGTATVSNDTGSQGLATAVADGATTITATDPSSTISGTAALTVTPVAPPPVSPAPAPAQLITNPKSGKRKAAITASGDHFTPGDVVTVTYLSGLRARKRASTVLCSTTVASDGTFSCGGSIPRMSRSGKKGQHTIVALDPQGDKSTSTFTLVRR